MVPVDHAVPGLVASGRLANDTPAPITELRGVFVLGGTLALGLALGGCGEPSPGMPSPSPSASPTPKPGGVVTGRYLLQIQPSPVCGLARGPLSFPMEAAPAGTVPHPGVQVVLEGDASSLELELVYPDCTLRGGMGTTGDGVLSNEGLRLWLHSIGTGGVFQASDGRGEVASGSLLGYLAMGGPNDAEGSLGTCSAQDHTFTLRAR